MFGFISRKEVLFKKNECGFLFRSEKVKNIFDRNFKIMKENGQYEALFRKYSQ